MKKIILFLFACLLCNGFLSAQEKMVIYHGGTVLQSPAIADVDSVKFHTVTSVFYLNTGNFQIPISDIDSITFETTSTGNIVYITYNGSNAPTVINPYAGNGVDISISDNHVTVAATSGIDNIEYRLSGTTQNGSLTLSSDKAVLISLSNVDLTNPSGSAINITNNVAATIQLPDASINQLSDGTSSTKNATILSKGALVFDGTGILNISGYKKHAISSDKTIKVLHGNIYILQSANDGFHSEGFSMDSGNLDIQNTLGDGIDAGGEKSEINNGTINIVSTADDVKGIKGDGGLTVNGGTINMTISGAQSKGFSTKANAVFNGGNSTIVTSGAAVLTSSGSGYDPSYCTAIKADGDITINNGTINIESKSTSDGGKGLSADGNITINNGNITITTAGDGKTYTNESGVADSYTACCIKADLNISLLGGSIICKSTGKGGKGISADGELILGISGAADENLILNVTTSGERFLVSGSGQSADYANPKAVKSLGNMTVNSGTITISCTQSQEGGEGLESKATLTINGGTLEISAYDDCINAANHIAINGGNAYVVSRGNDGIDSNGTLAITGGFTISCGTRSPEEGFDCDNNPFKITGGVAIGTGGATSNPTASVCTQPTIKYGSATPGNAICIKNSSGEAILMYQLPTYTGTGGGGPGGGTQMTLLFTDPKFTNGSYTLQYGGTISGGTTVHGYNTGGTYSGGSTKNFTISSMLTTIN